MRQNGWVRHQKAHSGCQQLLRAGGIPGEWRAQKDEMMIHAKSPYWVADIHGGHDAFPDKVYGNNR
jgi:hypothetical protein